jgi:ubiquinone/menaquinone biosynthesis C-methylase UbiE
MVFKDHFSTQAQTYADSRPDYPPELYEFIASQTKEHTLCWDVATGNGQAAVALAQYFDQVVATDASMAQLRLATGRKNIDYRCEPAEQSSLETDSVDLVTAAQALHWFDFERFYAEVRRALKPGGLVAAWTYGLLTVNDDIDSIIQSFYSGVLGGYWPQERRYVDEAYQTIPFPFSKVETPNLNIVREWTLEQLCSYLESWSAVEKYKSENGTSGVDLIKKQLEPYWTDNRRVTWPISLLLGE